MLDKAQALHRACPDVSRAKLVPWAMKSLLAYATDGKQGYVSVHVVMAKSDEVLRTVLQCLPVERRWRSA